MRRLACALLLVLSAAVLAGCGERSEPTGETAPLYPVTVQDAGDHTLTATAPARRIAALDPAATSLVRALGIGRELVGTPFTAGGAIETSALARLRPDLIVTTQPPDDRLARIASDAGGRLYVAPADSIRGVEKALTDLGLLTGRPVQARALVRRVEQQRRAVARRLAAAPRIPVFLDLGYFTTISDHTLAGDLLQEVRGRNVAEGNPPPGPFDLHQLATLAPQLYLASSDAGITLDDLRANPQAARLAAVAEGRFAVVPAALLEPRADLGTSIEALARIMHPDAFR